jgi:hypothetical protein
MTPRQAAARDASTTETSSPQKSGSETTSKSAEAAAAIDGLIELQQTAGNRALSRLFGGKSDPEVLSPPCQCADDAALDHEFEQWISYDAAKDAEETALVARINKEVFGPINQERNKIAADSFENTQAKKKAFPKGLKEDTATPAQRALFNTPTYDWIHSDKPEDTARQLDLGLLHPAGDLAATGAVVPNRFRAPSPPHALWSYTGPLAAETKMDFDMTIDSEVETQDNVSGFAEFKDTKGSQVFIPQLGFPAKPDVLRRQVMCGELPVVKPGRAKRLDGPTGQNVIGSSLLDLLHGGKHFFGKGTEPVITGKGEVLGFREGPDKPVHWFISSLPDDEKKRDAADKLMRKKADKILDEKRKKYERLKEFYLRRAEFIEKYKSYLK